MKDSVVKKKADRKSPGHPSIRAKASSDEDKDKNNKLVFENRSRRDNLEKILPPELMVKLEKIKRSWYNDVIGKYIPEAHPEAQASRRRIHTEKEKAKAPKKKITSTKKSGSGKVKNRNIGGVIGGGLNSQDVVGYLYDYKS